MTAVYLIVGWIAGCLTTGGALLIWSLVMDSREQEQP